MNNHNERMMDKPLVSVRMLTYNHEKYVAKAIESILMQNVNFEIELIIADDASTDNTQEIIKKYATDFPRIIKPILRNQNLGIAENSYHARKLCKGKYVSSLEGDDYWTDNHKLQNQVDFLEAHPEYYSVAHRHEIIDMDDNLIDVSLNFMEDNTSFNKEDALKYGTKLFHPNSVLHYNFFLNENLNLFFKNASKFGAHSLLVYYLVSKSNIYIFKKPMSVWRKVIHQNGDNYTSFAKRNPVEVALNDIDKYMVYRDFFGSQYNFNRIIREKTVILIVRIFKSKKTFINKVELSFNVFSKLSFKELILLPITFLSIFIAHSKDQIKK